MMSVQQQFPIVEEVLISSDSDDEVVMITNSDFEGDKRLINEANESTIETKDAHTIVYFSGNGSSKIERVYINGDFAILEASNSYDDEAISDSDVNLTNTESLFDNSVNNKNNEINEKNIESDDEQFYIVDGYPVSVGQVLNNSNNSKANNNLVSDVAECNDTLATIERVSTKTQENITIDSSGDEVETAQENEKVISMPSRAYKGFRVRGKRFIQMYCTECGVTITKCGKLHKDRKCCKLCGTTLIFQCKKCSMEYESYHSALNHLKKECQTQSFWRCPECDYTVITESKLEAHIKKVHVYVDPEKFVKCMKCNKKFRFQDELKKHEEMCLHPPKFHCKSCIYTTKWRTCITRHVKVSHSQLKGGYLTIVNNQMKPLDNQPTPRSNSPTDYAMIPTPVPEIANSPPESRSNEGEPDTQDLVNLYCSKCDLTFDNVKRKANVCENCDGPLLWQCIKCNKHSKSYCGIYDHLKNRCEYDNYICSKCKKKFHSQNDALVHEKLCGKELFMQCKFCTYKTRHKRNLKRHMNVKHNIENLII